MRKKSIWTLLLGLVIVAACADTKKQAPKYVTVQGEQFIDANGKGLIMTGFNMVCKDPTRGYVEEYDSSTFKKIAAEGFNTLRYGINWGALEPQAGVIDTVYLSRVEAEVKKANNAGLYVILDMHQDLYGNKFGNGAPAWATLDEGLPDVTDVQVWSERYYQSPAIQKSFDNFWANAKASDGVGLQDHYANAWSVVAEKFKDNTMVVGYDLMNEPFEGSNMMKTITTMFQSAAAALTNDKNPSPEAIAKVIEEYSSINNRAKMLTDLSDTVRYGKYTRGSAAACMPFEKDILSPFYQRVRDRIRTVDTSHIIFIEPAITSNMGIPSGLQPLNDGKGGRDTKQAFMPHAYDLVTDTEFAASASFERLGYIVKALKDKGTEMNMPVLIGEWGAFYGNSNCGPVAKAFKDLMRKYSLGDLYWSYYSSIYDSNYYPELK